MLRSDLCDYSDAYIVVKGTTNLSAAAANENDKAQKNVTFKHNPPFRSCISKTNSTMKENAKDLNIVMLLYDLLEHSQKYSMISRSLWNYYRDENDGFDDKALHGKSFNYKTKIVGKAQPGNEGDANRRQQPPVPALNVVVIFEDLLI